MRVPGSHVAMVGSCARTVSSEAPEVLMDREINRCMKDLYREGYRRFRVVRMLSNGDPEKRLVMGWPN